MSRNRKHLFYIQYYGAPPLKSVLDSLNTDSFTITVLDLTFQSQLFFIGTGVSVIDGSRIKNLIDLKNFLKSHVGSYDLFFTFSEVLVEFVAAFCKEFSLPYSGDSVISLSRNKFLLRKKWSEESNLKFFLIESREDLEKVTINEGICKPVNCMGSIGVKRMSLQELKEKYDLLIQELKQDISFERFGLIQPALIFEEYIEGDISYWYGDNYKENFASVCIIDGYLKGDNFKPLFILSHLSYLPGHVVYGTISCPPPLTEDKRKKITDFVASRVKLLGHENTIIHAEVVLCAQGKLEMIEVATRPGGRANQEVLKKITNFNPILEYVNTLLKIENDYGIPLKEGVSKYAASVAIMPADEHGSILPYSEYGFVHISRGISLISKNISSNLELVNARVFLKSKRENVKRLSSATVYALFVLTSNSYEEILKDVNYISKNQHLFFSK